MKTNLKILLRTTIFFLSILFENAHAQLANKFPAETAGYKLLGKPDCTSLNMAGIPPTNTCEQKYKNGSLEIAVSLTEYPKGNPILTGGGLQGDDGRISQNDYLEEKMVVGKATGSATYMKKTHFANVNLHVGDKLIIDISGQNQPNADVVKAFAKALKL